jgi:hypothetical protein
LEEKEKIIFQTFDIHSGDEEEIQSHCDKADMIIIVSEDEKATIKWIDYSKECVKLEFIVLISQGTQKNDLFEKEIKDGNYLILKEEEDFEKLNSILNSL